MPIDALLIVDIGQRDAVLDIIRRRGGDVPRETLGSEYAAMIVTGLTSPDNLPKRGVEVAYVGKANVSKVSSYDPSLESEAVYWNSRRDGNT